MDTTNEILIGLIPESMEALEKQLIEDGKRWGDTWRRRFVQNQEERIFAELNRYYDQWKHAGIPMPWAKIMGLAHIAMVRLNHPELLISDFRDYNIT